jgi:hypothetical protein
LPWWLPLVTKLANCEERVRGGGDQLEASSDALYAVIKFLELHPNIGRDGLTRSLHALLRALYDIRKGKPPELFKRQGTGGRPIGSNVTVKAVAAASLELLMHCGIDKAAAVNIVVRSLKKYGIRYAEGKEQPAPIDGEQVERWRYDVREAETSSVAKRIFDSIVMPARPLLPSQLTPQGASDLADECVESLHHTAF